MHVHSLLPGALAGGPGRPWHANHAVSLLDQPGCAGAKFLHNADCLFATTLPGSGQDLEHMPTC